MLHQILAHLGAGAQGADIQPGEDAAFAHLHLHARRGGQHLVGQTAAALQPLVVALQQLLVLDGRDGADGGSGAGRTQHVHRAAVEHVHDAVVGVDVADAQARQADALGDGADGEGALPHTGQGAGGHELDAVVDVVLKGLVAHQDQVVLHDEAAQLLQPFPPEHGGGGVVGVAHQHHLGAGGQPLFELLDADLVVVLLIQRHRHRHAAQQFAVEEVAGVAGVGHHDLVALFDEGHHGEQKAAVRAGGHDDVAAGVDGDTRALGDVLGQRLAQLIQADGHAVVGGEAALDGFHHRLFHRLRHGGVGEEGVRPGHDVAAGLHEVAGALAHVRFGHFQKQAALQVTETVVHLGLDIHCCILLFVSRVRR